MRPREEMLALLNNRAAYLFNAYERTGQLPFLMDAAGIMQAVVDSTPVGDPNYAGRQANLGNALQALFERTRDAQVLDQAVKAGRAAVTTASPDHRDRAWYLSCLGLALRMLFELTGDSAALSEAVQAARAAAAEAPSSHPNRPSIVANLGATLQIAFTRTQDPEVLAEAVQIGRAAVEVTPADNVERARSLANLGLALCKLSERTGDATVLAEAVQVGRAAAEAASTGHPDRASILANFAYTLRLRYERTRDTQDLADAAQALRGAIEATPADHPNVPKYMDLLGTTLGTLVKSTGDTADLTEAVHVLRIAAQARTPDDAGRHIYLVNLGHVLGMLFARTGDSAALAEAAQAGRSAVELAPPGHPDRPAILNSLGITLRTLYEQTGDTEVLTEAVRTGRAAVEATPTGHPVRPAALNSLGIVLRELFTRTRDSAVLAEAVQAGRAAAEAAPANYPDRDAILSTLTANLHMLFAATGDVTALAEAVHTGRAAAAAAPAGQPESATSLSNLGMALRALAENSGDTALMAEAVKAARAGVEVTPAEHPELARYLSGLGAALQMLSERTGDAAPQKEALNCYTQAAEDVLASAAVRFHAYRRAALLASAGLRDTQTALAAVEGAIDMLPLVAPHALVRSDRQYQLGHVAGLPSQAAGAAVDAGQPERAVELLEQTRGILIADTLAARGSDLARLQEAAPALADALKHLRARLDALENPVADASASHPQSGAPGHGDADPASAQLAGGTLAAARREAHTAWAELTDCIRTTVNDFADFLRPPRIEQLTAHAQDGPVVFVYTCPTRCDALILTGNPSTPVRLVPLTNLSQDSAIEHADQLRNAHRAAVDATASRETRAAAQADVLDVLAWLWDTTTGPVLDALGYTATPDHDDWPRIWWCPIGIVGTLPLHAAGHHQDRSADSSSQRSNPRTVVDRVISSYTSTLSGLAYARTHQPSTPARTVIVAAPDVPGSTPLPGATAEVQAIAALIPDTMLLTHPIRDTVLAALPDHQIAHFACHSHTDWTDPAASRLILPDHTTTPLTVTDISALKLTSALAYLSACETTSIVPQLADESVHITGAFHLAGYQHVIGTLWPIDDAAAHHLATGFYTRITQAGAIPPETSLAAHALHHATRDLRARHPNTPTHWAAHTHTGP
jgi:CHAT domain/Tetratricopeptide repeat